MVLVIVRTLFLGMLAAPFIWLPVEYYRGRSKTSTASDTAINGRWKKILNSAMLYALAFNLVFFIQELFLALGKKWLGLSAFLYHNNHTWDGDHPLASLAQGSGALAILIAGVVFLIVFLQFKNINPMLRLFFLWMSFHGFAQSLPQVPIGFIAPDTDTGQALTFMGLSETSQILIAIISIITYIFLMTRFSGWLLVFSSNETDNSSRPRFTYLRDIAVIGSIIGVVLIIPFRLPPVQQIMAPILVTLFAIPWVIANYNTKNARQAASSIPIAFSWTTLLALVVLLTLFQVILAKGVAV